MEQKPVAESLYIVPMGDSNQEHDMSYRMFVEALAREGAEREYALESAIILLVDMRADGLLDHLSKQLKWSRKQQAHGEVAASIYLRYAESYLQSLLMPKDPVPDVVRFMNLGMAVTFLWGMPESLVAAVRTSFSRQSVEPKQLQLPRPPPRESDIA